MVRSVLLAIACLCLTGPVIGALGVNASDGKVDVHSAKAFNIWLFAMEGENGNLRPQEYAAFQGFLNSEKVSDIVPTWQLLRTDADYAERCGLDAFAMPPRTKWSAIVPTLRLLRDEIIPVVGNVEVNSAWRSDALNDCVKGARHSKHLAFLAVDLVAPDRSDKRSMFADLCTMHDNVGPRTKMGLGAYYDPKTPKKNTDGRFHIDASGYRSWGFDYTRQSSGCQFVR